MGGVAKSNAKVYTEGDRRDLCRCCRRGRGAKESLTEIVDFLHNPERFREIGAKLPKGALWWDRPEPASIMLAKAVAGELGRALFLALGFRFR